MRRIIFDGSNAENEFRLEQVAQKLYVFNQFRKGDAPMRLSFFNCRVHGGRNDGLVDEQMHHLELIIQ
jgi:hypothetical protein